MTESRAEVLSASQDRPLLLVDVDGVLNPWAADTCPDGYQEYDFFPGERVLLSPGHGELLTRLAEQFELVWATAWEHRANRFICPVIAIPELPVIEFPLHGRDFMFRKLPSVIAAVGDRACAWIDDAHEPDHYQWARERQAPTLIVDIDPAEGLTAEVAELLAHWAAELADRP
jgi:HAD domain in Swiss Army Knife RNA repair proteins